MKIKVELFSVYREAIGEKEIEIEIKDGAKIKDIIQFLTKKISFHKEIHWICNFFNKS